VAITGSAKFLEKNKALAADGATVVVSSGSGTGESALDLNPLTFWRSVGSDDTTTETFVVTFSGTVTIDRILLVDINFKDFTVKYDVSGTPTDFTSVVGLDGSLGGGIAETAFADNTAYYEFDSVSTTKVTVSVTKTQVVDAQKYMSQFIATTELGTLTGFPQIERVVRSRNSRVKRMLSGRSLVEKSLESAMYTINFQDYPAGFSSDIDLVYTLFDSEKPFLTWLCGGVRGTSNFKYTLRGFRLKDIIQTQITNDIPTFYRSNVTTLPVNLRVELAQHV